MAKKYDHLFKLILIGDSAVGKTCILFRFTDSVYSSNIMSTIGVDFKIRTIELDGKIIKLQLWDTAGHERYKTITTTFYRGAVGIMLVYDVTNQRSFDNVTNWMRSIEEHAAPGVERILIGNKCDIQERKVPREKGENLARDYGIPFFETSAEKNINVDEAFLFLAKVIKNKQDATLTSTQSSDPALLKPGANSPRSSFLSSCSLI